MRTRLLLWLCFSAGLPLYLLTAPAAAELKIDDKTKAICNQMVLSIHNDILGRKDQFAELAHYGPEALFENPYGIYSIIYQFGVEQEGERDPRKLPYKFGLTIEAIGDDLLVGKKEPFRFEFPVLGIKLSGYQKKHLLRTQFDVKPVIKKHAEVLFDHQQHDLPLQMIITPLQESFQIKEDIFFQVTVINVGKSNLLVNELEASNLYFLVDNEYWGTGVDVEPEALTPRQQRMLRRQERQAAKAEEREARAQRRRGKGKPGPRVTKKGRKIILREGESLSLVLKGESFLVPKQIEILGTFKMKIRDVYPSAKATIQITE